ncbi:MAG: serine hydrolase [bacterium]
MWLALLVALAAPIDTTRLEAALGDVPPDFKAVVVVLPPGDTAGRWFGYRDTADDTHWYPASSLKIFPAVAALELLDAGGLGAASPSVEVAFERPGRAPYRRRLDWLVRQALTQSSNLAYDRLVQLVGVDALHAGLLGPERGFGQTAVQLTYSDSVATPPQHACWRARSWASATWAASAGSGASARRAAPPPRRPGRRPATARS